MRMAFDGQPLVTLGSDTGFDLDWHGTWTDKLSNAQVRANKSIAEAGKLLLGHYPIKIHGHSLESTRRSISWLKQCLVLGWNEVIEVEAHLMRIMNGAGPPGVGILQAVLIRWQKGKTPLSVFGLPAVQAVIHYKWETWARHALLAEFNVFLLWLASFITFAYSFRVRITSLIAMYTPQNCFHVLSCLTSFELSLIDRI